MMAGLMDCPVCGYGYDPAAEVACGSCPLQKGCQLVCCPACGHVTADVEQSRLARLISPILRRHTSGRAEATAGRTLVDVRPGERGAVRGFGPGVPTAQREQLQAYGISTGQEVVVVQHSPVTIIQVDHTELALEAEVAETVLVHDKT